MDVEAIYPATQKPARKNLYTFGIHSQKSLWPAIFYSIFVSLLRI